MRVTECLSFCNMTFLSVDETLPDSRKSVEFDGEKHPILTAYDIGERIVIRGEHELLGREIRINE